jgi:hypothetical protein
MVPNIMKFGKSYGSAEPTVILGDNGGSSEEDYNDDSFSPFFSDNSPLFSNHVVPKHPYRMRSISDNDIRLSQRAKARDGPFFALHIPSTLSFQSVVEDAFSDVRSQDEETVAEINNECEVYLKSSVLKRGASF